jgi:hypothetical protein
VIDLATTLAGEADYARFARPLLMRLLAACRLDVVYQRGQGDVLGPGGVDREGGPDLLFAHIHFVKGGRVQDQVGPQSGEGLHDLIPVPNLEIGVRQRDVVRVGKDPAQLGPNLPVGSNDHDSHPCVP